MKRTLSLVILVVLATGCATALQKRADTAFERGDYVTAADLYDEAVREKPTKQSLLEKRWRARAKAVEELSARTERERSRGREAAALSLARATAEARKKWFSAGDASRLEAKSHARVEALSNWAVDRSSHAIREELVAKRPLAAHHAWGRSHGMFVAAGLEDRASALREDVMRDGKARCEELKARLPTSAPHLTHWVSAYCTTFRSEPLSVEADAIQVSALVIKADAVSQTTPAERAQLEAQLEQLLLTTPWFHQNASAMAGANIRGHHTAQYTQRAAQRKAHWVERVPYQVQESYQEPYTDTERYTDQEPYTEYRNESYSCGYGTTSRTCSRSVPTTRYRSVSKTRTVTKYRTKYRTVTRYRDEPRVFTYDVTEHQGAYDAAWNIELALPPPAAPLVIDVRGEARQTSDEHAVTFTPAGITPVRAKLMTHEEWFENRLGALREDFSRKARAHWIASFCMGEVAVQEAAARCARGAAEDTPDQAKATLSAFLGDDAALLVSARNDS